MRLSSWLVAQFPAPLRYPASHCSSESGTRPRISVATHAERWSDHAPVTVVYE
ncbi:hypothetical protein ABZ930_21395 [Streptomyces sp. NPDC046716]|uniref:hypothetical protein n=1 Tax=Streptomyces sp. NPDC046716 TaxID=3157093 RepID=UPI0034001DE0